MYVLNSLAENHVGQVKMLATMEERRKKRLARVTRRRKLQNVGNRVKPRILPSSRTARMRRAVRSRPPCEIGIVSKDVKQLSSPSPASVGRRSLPLFFSSPLAIIRRRSRDEEDVRAEREK